MNGARIDPHVDDLTEAVCTRCGTDRELTRIDGDCVGGIWLGTVVCTPCLEVTNDE